MTQGPLDYSLIEDTAALDGFLDRIDGCPVVALDTESNSLHEYTERVTLIQVTGRQADGTCHHAVVDPLADVDVLRMGRLMADPAVVTVFHGADYDVVSLKRDYGFTFSNLYDTMIAARAVGKQKFGLADLVQEYFGVTLNKKYQKHDWGARPIIQEALNYAHMDTRYLPEIMDRLHALVVEKGREDMVAEECLLLEQRALAPKPEGNDGFLQMKGASKLREPAQRILRELYGWRERVAKHRNTPPFKVMGNQLLLDVAKAGPDSAAGLERVLGRGSRLLRRYGPALLDAVAAGKLDDTPLPKAPKKEGRRFSREDDALFRRLRDWRNAQAGTEGVEPAMVMNNQLLQEISAARPASADAVARVPGIRKWQQRRYAVQVVKEVETFQEEPQHVD